MCVRLSRHLFFFLPFRNLATVPANPFKFPRFSQARRLLLVCMITLQEFETWDDGPRGAAKQIAVVNHWTGSDFWLYRSSS